MVWIVLRQCPLALAFAMVMALSMPFRFGNAQDPVVGTGTAEGFSSPDEALSAEEIAAVRAVETERQRVIDSVIGSVVCIYGLDRQGGGSGVLIDPSGLALTNHHVIEGAGTRGLGGLSDGNLYEWDLIGTDPGGDVAIIRLKGRDAFPWSPLGDSDTVRVGDWTLAMGNPFLLAHDQVATVTFGVVSGVERFQGGMGNHQLVYGNCIQVDTSINPGNSGGPLFNMRGEIIGINGRGSFRDRGRVNVGLGYAISSNQIRNFIPDLLATKVIQHGTLDASFSERDGKIVCSELDLDSPAAQAGLELGDELLEFEGNAISFVNQYKNLICTLPAQWPADLRVRKPDGSELKISVRLFGLPYNFDPPHEEAETPPPPGEEDKDNDPDGEQNPPDEEDEIVPSEESMEMLQQFLLSEEGMPVNATANRENAAVLIERWKKELVPGDGPVAAQGFTVEDRIVEGDAEAGSQTITFCIDGRFRVEHRRGSDVAIFGYNGQEFWEKEADVQRTLTLVEAKTNPVIMQVVGMIGPAAPSLMQQFGEVSLEGGDQVAGEVSSRLVILDERGDWLYCWLGLPSSNVEKRPSHGLIRRISADRDSRRSGAIEYSDWRDAGGILIAHERTCIRDLDEKVQWKAICTATSVLESVDETWFRSQ